jgi:hypothetical protein
MRLLQNSFITINYYVNEKLDLIISSSYEIWIFAE